MLRIKRSVSHTYNTSVNMMSAQMLGQASSGTVSDLAPGMKDDMRMLEAKAAERGARVLAAALQALVAPADVLRQQDALAFDFLVPDGCEC